MLHSFIRNLKCATILLLLASLELCKMVKMQLLLSSLKGTKFDKNGNSSIDSTESSPVAAMIMKAWQINSYGDLNELQFTSTAEVPRISNPTDLLIKVNAASLNPIDKSMIGGFGKAALGFLRHNEWEFPLILGRDFSGTIIEKGHGVGNEFNIADNVYGVVPIHKQGSHAEMIVADKSNILLQPSHLNHVEAASILYAAMAAWSALFLIGELAVRGAQNSEVLILGGSGGVGTSAIQMLKSQNATVAATCSEDAVALVESLGADLVFDYRNSSYAEDVAAVGEYDIILDCVNFGHQNIPVSWKYKRFITLDSPLILNTDKYGLVAGVILSLNELIAANSRKFSEGKTVRWAYFLPSSKGLQFVGNLVRNKQIMPVIHEVFKFNDLPKAFETLTAGHLRGKIVIDMQ